MNYITNFSEARDEARRLTRVHGRDVEPKHVNCECDYSKTCYMCGGQGYFYELVFADCDHKVGDGELIECHADGCLDRKRTEPEVTVVKFEGEPLKSTRDLEIEEAERAYWQVRL